MQGLDGGTYASLKVHLARLGAGRGGEGGETAGSSRRERMVAGTRLVQETWRWVAKMYVRWGVKSPR